ncbi:uncharacterized protein [Diadema setosum]|uniref:uncharacterized protein n=1 Tax=Diadema setosum TaxID=31175 RepID=UPI003B3A6B74
MYGNSAALEQPSETVTPPSADPAFSGLDGDPDVQSSASDTVPSLERQTSLDEEAIVNDFGFPPPPDTETISATFSHTSEEDSSSAKHTAPNSERESGEQTDDFKSDDAQPDDGNSDDNKDFMSSPSDSQDQDNSPFPESNTASVQDSKNDLELQSREDPPPPPKNPLDETGAQQSSQSLETEEINPPQADPGSTNGTVDEAVSAAISDTESYSAEETVEGKNPEDIPEKLATDAQPPYNENDTAALESEVIAQLSSFDTITDGSSATLPVSTHGSEDDTPPSPQPTYNSVTVNMDEITKEDSGAINGGKDIDQLPIIEIQPTEGGPDRQKCSAAPLCMTMFFICIAIIVVTLVFYFVVSSESASDQATTEVPYGFTNIP